MAAQDQASMNKDDVVFNDLIENLQVGVFRCSIGNQPQFIYINSRLMSLLGLSHGDVDFGSIFIDSKKFRAFYHQLMEEGSAKAVEFELKGRGRKKFWASISAVTARDKQGKNSYIDGSIEDISNRKNLEKESLESKELFKTVFNNTAAAITVADKDERIVAWNPFTETLLGMKQEELFNKLVVDLYPKSEWKHIRALRIRQRGVL